MRQQRVDYLIYILSTAVDAYYHQQILQAELGFTTRKRNKAEESRFKAAETIPAEKAMGMVSIGDDQQLTVQSFTTEGKVYMLGVSTENCIQTCDCEDHAVKGIICKHIWLAVRITGCPIHNGSSAGPVPLLPRTLPAAGEADSAEPASGEADSTEPLPVAQASDPISDQPVLMPLVAQDPAPNPSNQVEVESKRQELIKMTEALLQEIKKMPVAGSPAAMNEQLDEMKASLSGVARMGRYPRSTLHSKQKR